MLPTIACTVPQKLNNGSRFEWTFTSVVCEKDASGTCICPKMTNMLKDDRIIRIANGTQKPVYKVSEFLRNQAKVDLMGASMLMNIDMSEMQRNAAKENPYKMTPEKQEWLLARMSDMPMRGMVSPVTSGAEAIDKPVDYLGVVGDVMEPQHENARKLGWHVETIGPDVDHAFIVGAPERALDFLRPRL